MLMPRSWAARTSPSATGRPSQSSTPASGRSAPERTAMRVDLSVPDVTNPRGGRFASLALRVAAVLLLFPSPSKGAAVPLAGAGQFAVFHLGCGTGSDAIGDLTVNTGTVVGDVGIGSVPPSAPN